MRRQCTQNLTTFLDFEFFHSAPMKHLLIVQLTIGNQIQFAESIYIAYTEGESDVRSVFCVHKHGFLMPGHK